MLYSFKPLNGNFHVRFPFLRLTPLNLCVLYKASFLIFQLESRPQTRDAINFKGSKTHASGQPTISLRTHGDTPFTSLRNARSTYEQICNLRLINSYVNSNILIFIPVCVPFVLMTCI
jgi:hypothetical protein